MAYRAWLAFLSFLSPALVLAACEQGRVGKPLNPHGLVVHDVEFVSKLTGAASPAQTDQRWNIVGTDLGFSFEYDGRIHMVFGDTWGRAGVEAADWRSNIMGVVEPDPVHGYVLTDVVSDGNGAAKELLESRKRRAGEYTVMPTGGIAIGDRMYVHYASLRAWKPERWGYKRPILNGSGFAYSDDGGQTWVKDQTAYWPGDTAFSQVAMVENGRHVYAFGTPAGRFGPAKLFRVGKDGLLDPTQYEYWASDGWSAKPTEAGKVVPAPVGELSVRWSPHHKRWLMMYLNDAVHNIVLRTAPRLEGPWDDERTVVTAAEYPTLYAPFMLPIAGPDVYFTMSLFKRDYNVLLMRFRLDEVEPGATQTPPVQGAVTER